MHDNANSRALALRQKSEHCSALQPKNRSAALLRARAQERIAMTALLMRKTDCNGKKSKIGKLKIVNRKSKIEKNRINCKVENFSKSGPNHEANEGPKGDLKASFIKVFIMDQFEISFESNLSMPSFT